MIDMIIQTGSLKRPSLSQSYDRCLDGHSCAVWSGVFMEFQQQNAPSDHLKIGPVYLVVIKMFDFLDGRRRRQMINPHGDSLFSSSLRHSGGLLFIFVLKATKYCNQKIF